MTDGSLILVPDGNFSEGGGGRQQWHRHCHLCGMIEEEGRGEEGKGKVCYLVCSLRIQLKESADSSKEWQMLHWQEEKR